MYSTGCGFNDKLNFKMEIKEGWSIDITNKNATHYYREGISLCGKATQKFYMDKFEKSVDYSQVLGFSCRFCYKKLKKELRYEAGM